MADTNLQSAINDGGLPAAKTDAAAPSVSALGRREREVMSVLWKLGKASVQQVSERLSTELAYTTVMTTLDRLFRKGLLRREKCSRAFFYSAVLSAKDVEGRRASDLIRRFFKESDMQDDVLVSCLVDAVHGYDTELLDQLDAAVRSARAQVQPAAGKKETRR
ncbi:MAG TPA: BlaI/MecI/CopY family transcriptional regulator [Acidobacteriaceae bacterium]|nr:BlaI/MecI/CopY family transcriptional regulator [Acidobacteriaceae bacterium]